MMRKKFLPLIIVVLLVIPWETRAQQPDQIPSQPVSKVPAVFRLLYNRVVIQRREGISLSGLLVGVEGDTLIIRMEDRDEKIDHRNLSKVRIELEKKRGRNVLPASVLGTYLGNVLFNRAKNQPTLYLKEKDPYEGGGSLILRNALSALAWAAAWYFGGYKLEKGSKEFNFIGSEEKRLAKWERLRRYITGEYAPKKINISVQAGYVFTRVSSRYTTLFKHAGYYPTSYTYLSDDYSEGATDFNLLRKLQLTLTAPSTNEFGIAVYWPGEPLVRGSKYDWGPYSEIEQALFTTAYYAVMVLKPPRFQKSKRISLNLGIGLGMAQVDFRIRTRLETWTPTYEVIRNQYNISKRLFSSVIFAELNIYPRGGVSLGLIADYVYIPSLQAPEIPEAGIPAQELRLGNASIGFSLGLHF
jgi:hypothetical protein